MEDNPKVTLVASVDAPSDLVQGLMEDSAASVDNLWEPLDVHLVSDMADNFMEASEVQVVSVAQVLSYMVATQITTTTMKDRRQPLVLPQSHLLALPQSHPRLPMPK